MRINELKYKNKNIKAPSKEKYKKFFKRLEKECSQAMQIFKSSKYRMYRGIRGVNKEIFKSKSLSNRKPLDSAKKLQTAIDDMLLKKGLEAIRSNSIFVTSDDEQASDYGSVYLIIPIDGFKFTWSDSVVDLHGELCDYNDTDNDTDFDSQQISDPTTIERSISYFKKKLLKTYSNRNLALALKSGNEIMISGKFYAIKMESALYWDLDEYLNGYDF